MSLWDHNPEWFDEWIERYSLAGSLGEVIRQKVESGEVTGDEVWSMLLADVITPVNGKKGWEIACQAETAFCESMVP